MNHTISNKTTIPGEQGVFIFVLVDIMVFFWLFVSYLFERLKDPALYNASQTLLSFEVGTANTLILLTSSWLVVLSIKALARGKRPTALFFLAATITLGCLFGAAKLVEYHDKLSVGITMKTNDFFMFYYMMTGLHFVHTVIGIIVLCTLFFRIRTGRSGLFGLESAATYWHMVDLLWIFIFPLLYVLR
ncbi:cytochrome c oxidase subunit 3 [Spongiibacter taiwanensis]|uniref:cytochrome c oxidase subunit 3 n=1 Tax=Spongiibacter taiwanensis TaxID=1748242 RepID=UPI0020365C0A|nr:cytochrome c oxidase subunit 3 [Spongiibacter taiwanensis]USA42619.1 cytochrome c oxidase subunit 3 [Spongiibacter taiwanensis]